MEKLEVQRAGNHRERPGGGGEGEPKIRRSGAEGRGGLRAAAIRAVVPEDAIGSDVSNPERTP